MPKFFVEDNQIEGNTIVIQGTDVNHIKNVLRYKVGQEIEITSKESSQGYICKIKQLMEDKIYCETANCTKQI